MAGIVVPFSTYLGEFCQRYRLPYEVTGYEDEAHNPIKPMEALLKKKNGDVGLDIIASYHAGQPRANLNGLLRASYVWRGPPSDAAVVLADTPLRDIFRKLYGADIVGSNYLREQDLAPKGSIVVAVPAQTFRVGSKYTGRDLDELLRIFSAAL